MSQTIADYVASLRLSPDIASLKKADRFFGILESKVARHSKKINQAGNLLGVGNTVKGVKALEKAEAERVKKSIKGTDAAANAHVKAYQKEFKALERKAHFENKERNAQINHLRKLAIAEKKLAAERSKAGLRAEKGVRYYIPPTPKQVKSKPTSASLHSSHAQLYRALQNQPKSKPTASSLMNSHVQQFRFLQNQKEAQAKAEKSTKYFDPTSANRTAERFGMQQGRYAMAQEKHAYWQQQRASAGGRTVGVAGVGGGLGALATAGVAGFGLSALNQVSQRLELLPVGLEAVTGSAEKAAVHLKFLEKLGRDVGATRLELVPEYTKMLASAIDTPLEQEMPKIFTSITRYGKVMGLDQESMKGTFKSVTQMIN